MKKRASFSKIFILASTLFVVACQKNDLKNPSPPPPPSGNEHALGYTGTDDLSHIPTTPNIGLGNGNLPSSVDLTAKFPPIGDQGQYGTCVAWATAYNLKTALNGMDKNFNAGQLASPANQFSPKDLFTAIDDDKKGSNCSGTNFSDALDLLQTRGVASLQTVPYTSLGDCSQSHVQQNWTTEAANNKIKYWRKINASVVDIKKNVANNIPVLMAAKLSDNFMTWNSDEVLSSNTTYTKVGQHSYHALVIAGYDDNKGPGGAFKVINSWGKYWGSTGYIWIDYNFLINEFCKSSTGDKPLFIASNEDGNVNPPAPDPNPSGSNVDLAAWVFSDASAYYSTGDPSEREITYNLYNIGNEAASSNADWSLYYIYYNAYDANDYGVLFYDKFNTSIESNTYNCTSGNCTINFSIPGGDDFANAAFGQSDITRRYNMPNINGDYYLVLIADVEDKFNEGDKLNNFFYTSIFPTHFDDGYAERGSGKKGFEFKNDMKVNRRDLRSNRFNTVVTPQFKNAYTPKEIISFFKRQKQSGALKNKVNQYLKEHGKATYFHKQN